MASHDDDYCYLTTTGRRSRRPHRIEIWYAADGDTLFLLAGGGRSSDWVLNLESHPVVSVELDGRVWPGRAVILDGDDERAVKARSRVFVKYQSRGHGDLSSWRDTALPVVIQLSPEWVGIGQGAAVQFSPELRERVADGSITVTYRRWSRPQVKVGGLYVAPSPIVTVIVRDAATDVPSLTGEVQEGTGI